MKGKQNINDTWQNPCCELKKSMLGRLDDQFYGWVVDVVMFPRDQLLLLKSNYWSIINAAFWLVELLLGYMFYSPLVAKSAGIENQNNGGWITFC